MNKKRRSGIPILLVVLIAAIAGLGYYYYTNKATVPSEISLPDPEIEKSRYTPAPDREAKSLGLTEATPLESVEADHDESLAADSLSSSRLSPETPVASRPAEPRTPAPGDESQERPLITGRIKKPASPGTNDGHPRTSPESGHLYPFSIPFTGSEQKKPGDDMFCEAAESEIQELFSYLGKKNYTPFDSGSSILDHLNEMTTALSASPPAPAGESLNPTLLVNNIYHIYRALSRTDITFIKNILRHERDDLELYMQMLYRWLSVSDQCPDTTLIRPSEEVAYLYAGFFLNTTGGRAIIFRRDPVFRLLLTYYCILIIHKADTEKRNPYGIDILPFIQSLRQEVAYHPELVFRDHYSAVLDKLNRYYRVSR
ncbi:MAG TPA: hypothetical protein ENN79_09440 [Desulfobacteraceae bacterium]|nr:hypothetical protein [Desulfobacteraceae bacterium]